MAEGGGNTADGRFSKSPLVYQIEGISDQVNPNTVRKHPDGYNIEAGTTGIKTVFLKIMQSNPGEFLLFFRTNRLLRFTKHC